MSEWNYEWCPMCQRFIPRGLDLDFPHIYTDHKAVASMNKVLQHIVSTGGMRK